MNYLSPASIHNKTMNYLDKVAHSDRSWANRTSRMMGTNSLAIGTAVSAAFAELLKFTLIQPAGLLLNGGLRTIRVITWSHVGESTLKQLPGAKDWLKSLQKMILLTATTLLSLMATVGSLVSSKPSQWNIRLQQKAGLYEKEILAETKAEEIPVTPPQQGRPEDLHKETSSQVREGQESPEESDQTETIETSAKDPVTVSDQEVIEAQGRELELFKPREVIAEIGSFSEDDVENQQPVDDDSTESMSEEVATEASTESLPEAAQELANSVLDSFIQIDASKLTPREKFLSKYEGQLDRAQIENLINSGRAELSRYHNAADIDVIIAELNQLSDPEVEQKMAAIIWFLMYQASKSDNDFEEGAFSIRDQDHKIAKVLKGLTISYERCSSHLKGQNTTTHMGIDIAPANAKLPYGKAHILIIPVIQEDDQSHWLYLKPEKHGVKGVAATLGHTYEYLHSLGRKTAPGLFGSDDAPEMRKERVPKDLLKEFNQLLPAGPEKSALLKQATIHGVKFMYQHAQRQTGVDFETFADKLYDKYGDNIRYTTGHEVILNDPLAASQLG